MKLQNRRGLIALMAAIVVLSFLSAGCGYVKNVRDDMMDIGTASVGFTPPVIPGDDGGEAVGPITPTIGVYAEATEFFHLGALGKGSGDLEWDRRGAGVVADSRVKLGFGPFHWGRINQKPIWVNDYKEEGNELDGWREHMREMEDPLFDAPAKELVFREEFNDTRFMHKGWQDWETFSLEVAIPEPFITHCGFYTRLGVDPSQIFDAALSIVCLDLYDDAAYNFDGSPRFKKLTGDEEN